MQNLIKIKGIFILLLPGLLWPHFAFCAVAFVKTEGVVQKYNTKTVTLQQEGNNTIIVPRKSIPAFYKLRTGQKVHAITDGKKLTTLLKRQKARQKKSQKAHPN